MRVLFASHAVPQKDLSGSQIQTWAIIEAMYKRGYQITFLYLQQFGGVVSHEDQIKNLLIDFPKIRVLTFDITKRVNSIANLIRKVLITKGHILPAFQFKKEILAAIAGDVYDLVFNYHYSAAAATDFIKNIPKVTITGDLLHSPIEARLALSRRAVKKLRILGLLQWVRTRHVLWRVKKVSVWLLNRSDISGSFGLSDARSLRTLGVCSSQHFYAPVSDSYRINSKQKRGAENGNVKIITAVGNLQSTSTYASLKYVTDNIIPVLEREVPGLYEIHVIGQGELQLDLLKLKASPNVVIRGFVDDVDHEFDTADILLLPTDVFIGFRTRIIKAFCHQVCVVTHELDTVNMPELINGVNSLYSADPEAIACQVVAAVKDKEMRERVAKSGRELFETLYSADRSCADLLKECERLIRRIQVRSATANGGLV